MREVAATSFDSQPSATAGDFLIVSQAEKDYDTAVASKGGTVRYMVEHILTPQTSKQLVKEGMWPEGFDLGSGPTAARVTEGGAVDEPSTAAGAAAGAGESSGEEDDMADVFVNRNGRRKYVESDSESSTDSDDEDDSGDE